MLRVLEKQTATETEIGILFFPQVKSSVKLEASTSRWLREQWWWMDEGQAGGWVGCASLGVWGEMQTPRKTQRCQKRVEGEVQWAQLCMLRTPPAIPTLKVKAFLLPRISNFQLASQLREPSLHPCTTAYMPIYGALMRSCSTGGLFARCTTHITCNELCCSTSNPRYTALIHSSKHSPGATNPTCLQQRLPPPSPCHSCPCRPPCCPVATKSILNLLARSRWRGTIWSLSWPAPPPGDTSPAHTATTLQGLALY